MSLIIVPAKKGVKAIKNAKICPRNKNPINKKMLNRENVCRELMVGNFVELLFTFLVNIT